MNNPKTKSFLEEAKDSFIEGLKKGFTEGAPSFLLLLIAAVVHGILIVAFGMITILASRYLFPEMVSGTLGAVLAYTATAWISHVFIQNKSSKRSGLLAIGWIFTSSPILLLPWGDKPIAPERFRFFWFPEIRTNMKSILISVRASTKALQRALFSL